MSIVMETTDIHLEESLTYRLEVRDKGPLDNFREGPYICHNVLVTHTEFLKKANDATEPRVYRILPIGGSNSNVGDVFALITWYFLCVYSCSAIPIACYCENKAISIVNAAILCVLLMYHLIVLYAITKNKKKFKRMLFVAETTADKYQGFQNYFFDVGTDNTDQLTFLNLKQRKKIRQEITLRHGKRMVIMLCTGSYWRSRVLCPIICLIILAIFSFIGIIVQLESISRSHS